jgi:hypothetical protein
MHGECSESAFEFERCKMAVRRLFRPASPIRPVNGGKGDGGGGGGCDGGGGGGFGGDGGNGYDFSGGNGDGGGTLHVKTFVFKPVLEGLLGGEVGYGDGGGGDGMMGAYGGACGDSGECGGGFGDEGGFGCTVSMFESCSYNPGGGLGEDGGPLPNATNRLLHDCNGQFSNGRYFIGQYTMARHSLRRS